jgi:hypothetical protein
MQNENDLNPPPQNTAQPDSQVATTAQPPSSVSIGGKVIQPLDPNLSAQPTTPVQVIGPTVSSNSPTNVSSRRSGVYPADSADTTSVNDNASPYTTMHQVGSQLTLEKKPLHWGIYIIAAWNMVGFALSFFSSSQTNTIYAVVMFLDLIVGIGLFFRLEVARKVMVWLAGILLVLSVISLILLVGLQQRIARSKANYNNAISHINQEQLTPQQQQQLATIQTNINNQQKEAGKAIGITYFKDSTSSVEGLVVIIYLTRPKIKDVFVELPT